MTVVVNTSFSDLSNIQSTLKTFAPLISDILVSHYTSYFLDTENFLIFQYSATWLTNIVYGVFYEVTICSLPNIQFFEICYTIKSCQYSGHYLTLCPYGVVNCGSKLTPLGTYRCYSAMKSKFCILSSTQSRSYSVSS